MLEKYILLKKYLLLHLDFLINKNVRLMKSMTHLKDLAKIQVFKGFILLCSKTTDFFNGVVNIFRNEKRIYFY